MSTEISVRPANLEHYERIVDYFLKGDRKFLDGMGVDPEKLPARESWIQLLHENHERPTVEKNIFYVIWHVNEKPAGHSNINKIIFGEEAYMHLHMWEPSIRKSGLGFQFVQQSIPFYFNKFQLKSLFCEPYARNPAPNATLKRLGFDFIKEYETVPGPISFLQPVNRWALSLDRFRDLFTK
jgi:RimJ/RimL family protein N-acetyltransferase